MKPYLFQVPESKKIRLIIHTDCKNEADDQYALVHQLLSPKFDVRGIVAGHFENGQTRYPAGTTVQESYDEVMRVLDYMELDVDYPVLHGASALMPDEKTPLDSEGARFIIAEALRDDPRPLYIGMQGAVTDLACAILLEPRICERMTAIWIGGGDYPEGGFEFNLKQDINAANVLFSSPMPLWQVPMNTYKQLAVTLAELQLKVQPYGKIGDYLFRQMAEFNLAMAGDAHWPHGETWGLGDQGIISVLLDEGEKVDGYRMVPAPRVDPITMRYVHGQTNRPIRVYHQLNVRHTLEDFFAKLQLQYPRQ